jgi:hypothetical protein
MYIYIRIIEVVLLYQQPVHAYTYIEGIFVDIHKTMFMTTHFSMCEYL